MEEYSLICTLVTSSGRRVSGVGFILITMYVRLPVIRVHYSTRAVELLLQVADHLAKIFEVPTLCRLIFDRGGVSYWPLWSRVPLSDLGPPITVPASLSQDEVSTYWHMDDPRASSSRSCF